MRLPVQAPVPGSGTPTKSNNPRNSNFRIFAAFSPSALLRSQRAILFIQPILQFSIQSRTFSIKRRMKGMGTILPRIQTPIADHMGMLRREAAIRPPRSSRMGIMEIIKTTSIGGSPPRRSVNFSASASVVPEAAKARDKAIVHIPFKFSILIIA